MYTQLALFNSIVDWEDQVIVNEKYSIIKVLDPDELNIKPLSIKIIDGFQISGFIFVMDEFPNIYKKLAMIVPNESIDFSDFGRETAIACETICAAICHQINWDYLRSAVFRKTAKQSEWVEPSYLKTISTEEIEELFVDYNKSEKIRAEERTNLLRSLGSSITNNGNDYKSIFLNENMTLNDINYITNILLSCSAFSNDPEEKKLQLLFQKLSSYQGFEGFGDICKPTIDYHVIRCFLRRGLVHPVTKYAKEYIFNVSAERKENTIGALRSLCSEVILNLCWLTKLSVGTINRIEWWLGRSVCIEDNPDCLLQRGDTAWLREHFDKCPFYKYCYAVNDNNSYLSLNEPTYKGTSF